MARVSMSKSKDPDVRANVETKADAGNTVESRFGTNFDKVFNIFDFMDLPGLRLCRA